MGETQWPYKYLFQVLRSELHRAEVELQDKCWVPPPALQHWLQYTYELELKTYNKKKNGAEKQLQQAKDAVRVEMVDDLAGSKMQAYHSCLVR